MPQYRRRGRPLGTGMDDIPHLEKVADMMVADCRLKATTAMKRLNVPSKDCGASQAALIHRLQEKWKLNKERLLLDARQRARLEFAKRQRAWHDSLVARWKDLRISDYKWPTDELAAQLRAATEILQFPQMGEWSAVGAKLIAVPEMKAVQEQMRLHLDNPEMRAAQESALRFSKQLNDLLWPMREQMARMAQELKAWHVAPEISMHLPKKFE